MTKRDDFPEAVKIELAKRAAYRCSAPTCRAQTIGPSETRKSGANSVGVAAHITAAAPGGPRYDPNLTPKERSSADNGVWLCETHGRAVDNDTVRFTTALLHQWRRRAEERAALELGAAERRDDDRSLLTHRAALPCVSRDELHAAIDRFMNDVGVASAWGAQQAQMARLMLYELALNSITHGSADGVEISASENEITLACSSDRFGLSDLRSARGQGGQSTLRLLEERESGTLSLVHRDTEDGAQWSIIDVLAYPDDSPCGMSVQELGDDENRDFSDVRQQFEGCDEIHLYPPRLLSLSDVYRYYRLLPQAFPEARLVFHGVSPSDPVGSFLLEMFPDSKIQ